MVDPVFLHFRRLALHSRQDRYAGAIVGAAAGVGFMGAGAALLATGRDEIVAPVFLVGGGVMLGLSGLLALLPSQPERLASEYDVFSDHHSPEEARALQRAWARMARTTRVLRIASGILLVSAGAALVTVGVAQLAEASSQDSTSQSAFWVVAGSLVAGTGVAFALTPVPVERTYQDYEALRGVGRKALRAEVMAVPAGLALGLRREF